MRKIFLASALLLSSAFAMFAVPAYPGRIEVKGPDGTVTAVYLHGDEFCHWATDASGREVSISPNGIVRALPATKAPRIHTPSKRRVYTPTPSAITRGNNHFLVLLVEFADKAFTLDNPKDRFTRLLNEDGYSDFGGTGSVHKYYYEQSSGAFDPVFDVVGPVRVSGKVADYGGNENDERGEDKNAVGAFAEAVRLAHEQGLVNFSNYDADGDGYVDNIFFYYAGYNEAEGGGDDTIWPHAYGFMGSNSASYDGVRLGRYACTSELKGNSGSTMCGIGTFCHEFGHVLGLPDFYDTDYEENGKAATVYAFSLMCQGNYNNNGCTPPNLGAIERNMLGWMDFPAEWTEAGDKTVRPITANEAFRLSSTNPGEFFLIEVRDGTGWDAYISGSPAGTLIYHVDQSSNIVINGYSAISLWDRWAINTVGAHPCYFVVAASFDKQYGSYVFPGTSGKSSFGAATNPSNKDYLGGNAGFELTDIAFGGGVATMHLEFCDYRILKGKVTDSAGEPLAGVTVSVEDASSPASPAPARVPGRFMSSREAKLATAAASCITAADGSYSLEIPMSAELPFEVTYSKPYYNPRTVSVNLPNGTFVKDVVLRNVAESDKVDLQKYTAPSGYGIGLNNVPLPQSITAGVYYEASELVNYVGMRISDISFLFYCNSVDEVSVFVDFGMERVYSQVVPAAQKKKMNKVDISAADIRIPADTDVNFGYALKNADYGYPLAIDGEDDPVDGGCVIALGYMYPADGEEWSSANYNLVVGASVQSVSSPFAAIGIKVIANPGGYHAGDSFTFRFSESGGETPITTVWYLDGEAQTEGSAVLTAGRHEVTALCTYADGSTEEISQVIEVQ